MATVNIVFARAMERQTPVASMPPFSKEDITSSASSVVSANSAPNDAVCIITVTGGNIRAAFGPSPSAVASGDILITDGQTREFMLPQGHKVAVING